MAVARFVSRRSKAGSPGSGCRAQFRPGEGAAPSSQSPPSHRIPRWPFLGVCTAWDRSALSWKATNCVTGAPPSRLPLALIIYQRCHLQTPSHRGLGLQQVPRGWGHKHPAQKASYVSLPVCGMDVPARVGKIKGKTDGLWTR